MFKFESPLFWYRLIFLAELIISECVFTFKLKKRPNFAIRSIIAVIGCYVITFLFPLLAFNGYYLSFMFLCMFILTIIGLYFCYDAPLLNILFCAIAAYAVQHIAYELYTILITAFQLDTGDMPYSEDGFMLFSIWSVSLYIESYGAVYALMYLFFGSKIKANSDLKINHISLFVISAIMVVVAVLLNAVMTYQIKDDTSIFNVCLLRGCILTCCVLAAFIQFFILDRKEMQNEIDTLHRLHDEEKKHYMMFKENVDYINIKCHDLKHQIRRIAQAGKVDDKVIDEIESSILIYDSDVKSGNEVLDIVLTEKRLICAQNHINFSCITDGQQLNFMKDSDICSLFGNALDNAIEAVCRIDDVEKRSIGLSVRASYDFISVCVRNSCYETITFDGDLPKSTKGDDRNHGFGVKSIKEITKRYGGEFSIVTSDNVFTLNLLFPKNQQS